MPSLAKSLAKSLGKSLGRSLARSRAPVLLGLRNFSAANYYATQAGGGEAGVATGFGLCSLFVPRASTFAAAQMLAGNSKTAFPYNGHQLAISAAGGVNAAFVNGAGTFVGSPEYRLTPSDVGRVMLVVGYLDGAGALRLRVGRLDEVANGSACAGYSPGTLPHSIGSLAGAFGANGCWILASSAFRGVPSDAEFKAFADAVRVLGDLPLTMAGATVTHRWSLRDTLAGTQVVSDQIAPASLADTVTGAPGDAMARVGSPTVVVIDPSVDGRKSYGVQGAETGNYLQTEPGVGIRGAVEFVVGWYGRIDALLNATAGVLAECWETGKGWLLVANGANLTNIGLSVHGGDGVQKNSAFWAPVAADTGTPVMIIGQVSGGFIRLFLKRPGAALVQIGADQSIVGYQPPSITVRMTALARAGGSFPLRNVSSFGLGSGNGSSTLAELQAWADDIVDKTGRMKPIAGKTLALTYDFTTDIDANGGPQNGVPAQELDRIGTAHLTRVGVAVQTDANSIRAVGPYSAADGWATAPGSGIRGAVSGLNVELDVWLTKVPTTTELIAHCTDSLAKTGWLVQAASAVLRFFIGNGSSLTLSSPYTLTGADLNKRLRITANYTAAGALQLFINGVQIGPDVPIVSGAYAVPAATIVSQVGQFYGAQGFSSGYVETLQGGHASLAAGNVATLNASLTVSPPSLGGALTTKRWRFEDDIAAANGALPFRSVERISGGDDLVRIGSPLQVAQRVERLWGYESTPIMYAADGLAYNARFTCSPGFAGDAAGWWWNLVLRIVSQNVPSRARVLLGCSPGGSGFSLYSYTTNSTLQAMFTNAAGAATNAPSIVIAPGDVGKVLSIYGVADVVSGKAKLYNKRLDQAGGNLVGYKPAVGGHPFYLGDVTASDASEGVQIIGYQHGLGIPAFAQIAANYDAGMAAEDVAAIPGMSTSLYSLTRSIRENGGAMPATLIDRISGADLTTVGNPTVAPIHARQWGF